MVSISASSLMEPDFAVGLLHCVKPDSNKSSNKLYCIFISGMVMNSFFYFFADCLSRFIDDKRVLCNRLIIREL